MVVSVVNVLDLTEGALSHMPKHFPGRRIASAVAAGVMVCSMLAQPAEAHPNSFVGFGDSVIANPTVQDYLEAKSGNTNNPNAHSGCATDPNGIVKQVAAELGLVPFDYSCAGASAITGGQHLSAQIDEALADGALSPGTQQVMLTIGANDTYPRLFNRENPDDIVRNVVDAVVPQIRRIQEAAPHARIKVVGYPSMADLHGVCLVQLGSNIHSYEPLREVIDLENLMERISRDVATAAGVEYVDLRGPSYGHGMCAPDGQRWYAALIDFGEFHNLPIHMTNIGIESVSRLIAAS